MKALCKHPSTARVALFAAKDPVSRDLFRVEQCSCCGLSLTQPVPAPESIDRYYPEAYYGDPSRRRFPAIVEKLQGMLYASRARRIGRLVEVQPRRVLDIGCGKGFLLDAFRREGWIVQGLELSEHSARHGREILGLRIHVGSLSDPGLAEQPFHAAVLWHVLEHVPDPDKALGEIAHLLAPDGVLLVSVPNFGSPEARIFKSGWFHLDVPRHLIHLDKACLLALLTERGFDIVQRWRFAPEFDLFSFVQSALNGIGLPPNQLYTLLRGKGAKLQGSRGHWWQAPASLALAIPLGLLGLLWIPVAGWLGTGSTMTFVARKTKSV